MRLSGSAEITDETIAVMRKKRDIVRIHLAEILTPGTVICLPTAPFPAPETGLPQSQMWDRRQRIITLTCLAGMLGAPQINLPLAEVDNLPVGLSLIGSPGSDSLLTGFARSLSR